VPHFCERRERILGGCGLADTSFTVKCDLS